MRRSIRLGAALVAAGFLALPAAARDCAKPSSAVDKAICTDPKLKAANDEMATALQAVLPLVGNAMAESLWENQRAWDADLDERCGENSTLDENRVACIMPLIAKRTAFLMASPKTGPGGPDRLAPYVASQAHSDTMCAGKVEAFDFGDEAKTPGEKAFSQSVHYLVAALNAGDFARVEEKDPDNRCAYFFYDAAVTYASSTLVAANMPTFFDDDAQHGHYDQHSVVTDLAAGKTLTFADVFPESATAGLIADCTKALRDARVAGKGRQQDETEEPQGDEPPTGDWAQTVDREMKEYYAETIRARVTDLSHWIVYADHAEIYFPEQSIGSNVEGYFTCPFTNAQLAAYAGAKGWIVK